MSRTLLIYLLLLIGLSACGSATTQPVAAITPAWTQTPSSNPTSTATLTPVNTATPSLEPTRTPRPTREPTPTRTPNYAATATTEYNDTAIREAFEQYRSALLMGDGEQVLEVISSLVIERYDWAVADALGLSREELDLLDPSEKLRVLRLRHEFVLEELQNLTGEEVIILAVERGWLGSKELLAQLEIDEIMIGIRPSDAFVTFKGMSFEDSMFFIREEGRYWRVFLRLNPSLTNEAIRQLIDESGLTENEVMAGILEVVSGREVDERIFDGPVE